MLAFFIATVIAVALDLWTKHLAFHYFETVSSSTSIIDSFLYFTHAENTGVAFGMLQGWNQILSYALPLVLIGLPIYIYANRKEPTSHLILLGFVYGGATGNYYDRVVFGFVRDFIDVRLLSYNYPIFNIADAFISCSVVLLLILTWSKGSKSKEEL